MKKTILILSAFLIFLSCESTQEPKEYIEPDFLEKPVIYLYPEVPTEVSVKLDYKGIITAEYPESNDGVWSVLAQADGSLSMNMRTYPYLFWEGVSPLTDSFEIDEGFIISKDEVTPFLEEKLTLLGLNEKEQADFITYWMPKMTIHEWVKLKFLYEEYENIAHLSITPKPDNLIRVFMIFEGLESEIELAEQDLSKATQRFGFTAVEWGGSELTQ